MLPEAREDGSDELDVRMTAALVGRTPETVRRWIWSGELPARRQGNLLLIARPDLESWLARRARPATVSLSHWADDLESWPTTERGRPRPAPGTAADLILEDRRRRSTEVEPRARR